MGESLDIFLFCLIVAFDERDEDPVDAVAHFPCRSGVAQNRGVEVRRKQWIFPGLVFLKRETLMVGSWENKDNDCHRYYGESESDEIEL